MSPQEIAEAIGYNSADVVHAFTHGTAKLPINRIARALEIDSVFLRLVLWEYMPDVLVAIDDETGPV